MEGKQLRFRVLIPNSLHHIFYATKYVLLVYRRHFPLKLRTAMPIHPTEPALKETTATFHTLHYEIFLMVFAFLQLCQRHEIYFHFTPKSTLTRNPNKI